MNPIATTIVTPAGIFPAPLNPSFAAARLKLCETKEDLFKLVDNQFVDPDAMNEVLQRGWYQDYLSWRKQQIEEGAANP